MEFSKFVFLFCSLIKKSSKFNFSKENIEILKSARGTAEIVFYDSWYQIVKGIISRDSGVLTFFSDFRPGSRFAYFVYIAFCPAQ